MAQVEGDGCEYCGGMLMWVDANLFDKIAATPQGRILVCEHCEREAQNSFEYYEDED